MWEKSGGRALNKWMSANPIANSFQFVVRKTNHQSPWMVKETQVSTPTA